MTTECWPNNLPDAFLREGIRIAPLDNRDLAPADEGPGLRWPTLPRALRPISGQITMTPDQWTELMEFYRDALGSGGKGFDFPRPMGAGRSTMIEVKFRDVPRRRRRRSNWLVSIKLRTT